MTLSNYALDYFIAPKLSQLTICNAPDISKSKYAISAEHYIKNFILNSIFHGRLENPTYAYLFNFLRRTQAAVSEYRLAREKLKTYIDTLGEQRITLYLSSLSNFEMFLGHSAQSAELLIKFLREETQFSDIKILITKYAKLKRFYEFSKHAELQISNKAYPQNGTVTVWVTNSGLEIERNQKSEEFNWLEIADTLDTLNELAIIIEKLPYEKKLFQSVTSK